jgi:hypothetical protein
MADVQIVTGENGDVHVGFVDGDTFVPFAHVGANRIAQLKERAASLSELAKADDADSQRRHDEAAAALPYTTKTTKAKGGAS